MNDFLSHGLRFGCTQCSRCCRHDPGYVFLSPADCSAIADFLGISCNELVASRCRKVVLGGGLTMVSLLEKENHDCTFWNNAEGCTVYEARPVQCRTYPFWASAVEDWESWNREAVHCPGIGQGRVYTRDEIEALLAMRRQNHPMTV